MNISQAQPADDREIYLDTYKNFFLASTPR
jgi:hypothetical protein